MKLDHLKRFSLTRLCLLISGIGLGLVQTSLMAGGTDLSQAPLATAAAISIKPNIMFVLDDSGSMDSDYMPDDRGNNSNKRCFGYNGYNSIFYNPNTTYPPPVKADGTFYPNASFSGAYNDGYKQSGSATDLSNMQFFANTLGYYYTTLAAPSSTCLADNQYTRVTTLSVAEQTNYANWWSYYRTRMMMMRAATGFAFQTIDAKYRVGIFTINLNQGAAANFIDIKDFDSTQKALFYDTLYKKTTPNNSTPLRVALAKAGKYFANKITGQLDPVQYSCQQNFTILTTDGLWNESNTPTGLDGNAIGNPDGPATSGNAYPTTKIKDTTQMPTVAYLPAAGRPLLDDWRSVSGADKTGGAGISNTLADVAYYYYNTDLRDTQWGNCTGALGVDVCENNVTGNAPDNFKTQHMTTFTMGLGVNGQLSYSANYLSAGSADYNAIANGTKPWPKPVSNTITTIDDLWHAAVNGRGVYYSASDATTVADGLAKALAGVNARDGSSAAAATSNLIPVTNDNYVFFAKYRTVNWDGDLLAYTIDPSTGVLSTTSLWSAQAQIDSQIQAVGNTGLNGRHIYFRHPSGTHALTEFTYSNLQTASLNGYFDNFCSGTTKLSQCSTLSSAQKALVDSGTNLVNFLRGQDAYENQANVAAGNQIFRDRAHALGDMVSSTPVYLKAPQFSYNDLDYTTFKTDYAGRAATVFVAANDGMLHAFDATTGAERWAYVPTAVMPNMYALADDSYSSNHRYFVDGSPTIGDVYNGSNWKTIMVGGFRAGGRGYYALDVTNPAAPVSLWEFTASTTCLTDTQANSGSYGADCNIGYSFGNPIITKLSDGTWVAIVSSGYNNTGPGDGNGYLYVLNAFTGKIIHRIATYTSGTTPAGTATNPSGLGKLNAWVDDPSNNTAGRIYGGDLLGNLWRFDINDSIDPSGREAMLLAQFKIGSTPQPITTKPELAEVNYNGAKYPVVIAGTGRYLGVSDIANTDQQSIYIVKDGLSSTGLGNIRARSDMVVQTATAGTGGIWNVNNTPVNWATKSGWYFDLNPGTQASWIGERVNVDMQLQGNVLGIAGNAPNSNACTVGGYSRVWYFNFTTGKGISTAITPNNALIAGLTMIQIGNKIGTLVTDTSGSIPRLDTGQGSIGSMGTTAVRTSWRELSDD